MVESKNEVYPVSIPDDEHAIVGRSGPFFIAYGPIVDPAILFNRSLFRWLSSVVFLS